MLLSSLDMAGDPLWLYITAVQMYIIYSNFQSFPVQFFFFLTLICSCNHKSYFNKKDDRAITWLSHILVYFASLYGVPYKEGKQLIPWEKQKVLIKFGHSGAQLL